MIHLRIGALLWLASTLAAFAAPASWTVTNPTDVEYVDEPVRLDVGLGDAAGAFVVRARGQEVPSQIESIDGRRWVWVSASVKAGQAMECAVAPGTPAAGGKPKVMLRREQDSYVLDNGLIAARLPAAAGTGIPGPISAIRIGDGPWIGASFWNTQRKLKSFTAEVVGDGTVFAKVRLRYEFEGMAGIWGKTPSFAQIEVTLAPHTQHLAIEESHEMSAGDSWEFDATAGWQARHALCEIFGGAAGKPINRANWPRDFKPLGWSREALDKRYSESDPRIGNTLLWLIARWNQHYQDGWFFAASDQKNALGAIACRAGKWFWPHDNKIEFRARDSGDYAGLRCPTWRGKRYWLLIAGPHDKFATQTVETSPGRNRLVIPAGDYAFRHGFRPLDKVLYDYITTWPGREDGKPAYPASLNPLYMGRGFLGGSHGSASAATPLQRLLQAQIMLDYDFYGTYWYFWSPENPNFYTSLLSRPMGMVKEFKDHPRFKDLAGLVQSRFYEDVYHSVTLPGGAGQECPGYFSVNGITSMARRFRDELGFDGTKWPQVAAGREFLWRISQPRPGGIRIYHPGGDTHPGPNGPSPASMYKGSEPTTWKTDEFPGFGVIFRNHSGTDRETYLAFKAGPNRGHFHGDQLSFHYCAHALPLAVDHFCSYRPRAGQEHMHNRVAFATDDLPFANMDGYERLIALKRGDVADIAIAQVESPRLRYVTKLPPEDWDRDQPQHPFKTPLAYRRTVVQMKGAGQDYFVIRDQYANAEGLKAIYCLHLYGDRCERKGNTIDFDGLSVFVAEPVTFDYSRFDWSHSNGGGESTKGIRLAVAGAQGQFITVLYPKALRQGGAATRPAYERAPLPTIASVAGGVHVGDDEIIFAGGLDHAAQMAYVTVKRGGKDAATLSGADINLDRPQGNIGLFIPDAGYPFGPIPDWLIRQRIEPPKDAPRPWNQRW